MYQKNPKKQQRPMMRNRKAGSSTKGRGISTHPPALVYEETRSKKLRFTVTANTGAGSVITFQNLLDTICVASSAVAPYDLYDLVRIGSVTVWSQAALGTPTTVGVVFDSTTGDRSFHTDTSLGVRPAFVHAVPNRRSLSSFFQPSTAGNAFVVIAPAGSIIDVELHFRDIPGTAVAAANASIGAPVGSIFYRGLDGVAIATTNFPPPAGVSSF